MRPAPCERPWQPSSQTGSLSLVEETSLSDVVWEEGGGEGGEGGGWGKVEGGREKRRKGGKEDRGRGGGREEKRGKGVGKGYTERGGTCTLYKKEWC